MDLMLRTYEIEGATVVEVGGEVELHSANELRDELARASETEKPCVVVDLSRVTFIDSTGLGVVVGAFKRVRERGSLSIVCPQRSVRRVFQITGLLQILPFFDTVDAAIHACALSSTRSSSETELQTAIAGETQPNNDGGRDG